MSLTLQNILDEVLMLSGMGTESAYADNDDDAIKRLFVIANQSARMLAEYPWQALRKTYEFTLSSDTEYALPSDYRAFVPDTFYSDNRTTPVHFPTSPEDWGYLQASGGGTGVRFKARLLGNLIQFYQPVSGEVMRIEYQSNAPIQATGAGDFKSRYTADSDVWLLDDQLHIFDVTWRYKKLLGLDDWQADLAEMKAYEKTLKGKQAGSQTIRPGVCMDEYPYNLWRPVPNDP